MNYDLDYYERMLRQNSITGEQIARIRWDWLSHLNLEKVLDYGSGIGWFRAWRPQGIEVWSYDIGNYPQTGIELQIYDVLCLWDVLEHIGDLKELEHLFRLSNNIAISVPIKPENKPYLSWKHLKPGEHIHMFSIDTIIALFDKYGFTLTKHSDKIKCPPREDIHNFLFKSKGER
jgi:hypothetical protein